jgi:uncharacterized ion transporter superfamily protein YfcC
MYVNLKNIKFISKFYLILFFFIYLLFNFHATNLVFAGKFHSKIQQTDSLEKIFNSSGKEIDILRFQIDHLSKEKISILKEIDRLEENLLFHLKIQNKNNYNIEERNSIFLKFQISFVKQKRDLLKKQLKQNVLEQKYLEMKLRKKRLS